MFPFDQMLHGWKSLCPHVCKAPFTAFCTGHRASKKKMWWKDVSKRLSAATSITQLHLRWWLCQAREHVLHCTSLKVFCTILLNYFNLLTLHALRFRNPFVFFELKKTLFSRKNKSFNSNHEILGSNNSPNISLLINEIQDTGNFLPGKTLEGFLFVLFCFAKNSVFEQSTIFSYLVERKKHISSMLPDTCMNIWSTVSFDLFHTLLHWAQQPLRPNSILYIKQNVLCETLEPNTLGNMAWVEE